MTKWFIDKKPDDFLDGEQVYRISIGGNQKSGYYITYRGDIKTIGELLMAASANFNKTIEHYSGNIHGDNLAAELNKIVVEALPDLPLEDYKRLMEPLVMFCAKRDHKVHLAGVEVGKQIAGGDLEPEEEQ